MKKLPLRRTTHVLPRVPDENPLRRNTITTNTVLRVKKTTPRQRRRLPLTLPTVKQIRLSPALNKRSLRRIRLKRNLMQTLSHTISHQITEEPVGGEETARGAPSRGWGVPKDKSAPPPPYGAPTSPATPSTDTQRGGVTGLASSRSAAGQAGGQCTIGSAWMRTAHACCGATPARSLAPRWDRAHAPTQLGGSPSTVMASGRIVDGCGLTMTGLPVARLANSPG